MSCGLVPWASVLCELMTPDPCHSKAIDMQRCLKANRYREGACFGAMTVMEKCCTRWKGRSSCCMFYETKRPSSVSRKNPINDLNSGLHTWEDTLKLSIQTFPDNDLHTWKDT